MHNCHQYVFMQCINLCMCVLMKQGSVLEEKFKRGKRIYQAGGESGQLAN